VADAAFHIHAVEIQKPQMVRIVLVMDLQDLPVGGHDSLQLSFTLNDPFLHINHRQRFHFVVEKGLLKIHQETDRSEVTDSAEPEIDIRGLTALVFGVIKEEADELETRGWGSFFGNTAARKAVKAMFPPTTKPFLFENF